MIDAMRTSEVAAAAVSLRGRLGVAADPARAARFRSADCSTNSTCCM